MDDLLDLFDRDSRQRRGDRRPARGIRALLDRFADDDDDRRSRYADDDELPRERRREQHRRRDDFDPFDL